MLRYLKYLQDLRRTLENLPVSGRQNMAIMIDALRSLDVLIDIICNPPKVEEKTTTQTIELPVDPALTGGDDHASDQ